MTVETATVDGLLRQARRVADAILYEGYLLYPYRASSTKNQVRWQFGVLGPRGAVEAGVGEPARMSTSCLVRVGDPGVELQVHVRFLQVQQRQVDAVKLLLAKGANPDKKDAAAGYSAREYAKRDTRNRDILAVIEAAGAQTKPAKKAEDLDSFKLK